MEEIKIFLLDDHKIVRDGLKSLLTISPIFKVVGEESHPDAFLKALAHLNFDLLILDISLPGMSGLDVLKQVKTMKPGTLVVMLSMHDNPEYILKAMREGANAYLPKDIEAEEFIHALKEVKLKGTYFPSPTKVNFSEELVPSAIAGTKDLLTPKEIEVLEEIAKGLSSKQIAAAYGLSSRTIETHRLNIMKKLGTNNSAETIAIATKLNLIKTAFQSPH